MSLFHKHEPGEGDPGDAGGPANATSYEVLEADGKVARYAREDFDEIFETADPDEVQRQVAGRVRQSLGELPKIGFVGVREEFIAQRGELAVDEAGNVCGRHGKLVFVWEFLRGGILNRTMRSLVALGDLDAVIDAGAVSDGADDEGSEEAAAERRDEIPDNGAHDRPTDETADLFHDSHLE